MIAEGLQIYLADNQQSWEMDADGHYLRRARNKLLRPERKLIELLKP